MFDLRFIIVHGRYDTSAGTWYTYMVHVHSHDNTCDTHMIHTCSSAFVCDVSVVVVVSVGFAYVHSWAQAPSLVLQAQAVLEVLRHFLFNCFVKFCLSIKSTAWTALKPRHKHILKMKILKAELSCGFKSLKAWFLWFLWINNYASNRTWYNKTIVSFNSESTAHSNDIIVSYCEKMSKIGKMPLCFLPNAFMPLCLEMPLCQNAFMLITWCFTQI